MTHGYWWRLQNMPAKWTAILLLVLAQTLHAAAPPKRTSVELYPKQVWKDGTVITSPWISVNKVLRYAGLGISREPTWTDPKRIVIIEIFKSIDNGKTSAGRICVFAAAGGTVIYQETSLMLSWNQCPYERFADATHLRGVITVKGGDVEMRITAEVVE